jgi:hypothetical protein
MRGVRRFAMLKIRRVQMDALASEMVITFEERAAEYLREAHPEWCEETGAAGLAAFVRHGTARAPVHGFSVEGDVIRYLLAMQALGERFDEAPEHPWARTLLAARMPPGEKINRLLDAVTYQQEARRIRNGR